MRSNLVVFAVVLGLAGACSDPEEPSGSGTGSASDPASTFTSTGGSSTTAAASSSSTTSEDASTSMGSSCIGCPKDLPQDNTCDLWQDDCPDGQKCNLWADDGGGTWNASKCVPLDPDPAGAGEPCTVEETPASGLDNCGASAVCRVEDAETLEGECQPLCFGSPEQPECEDPERICSQFSAGPAFCITPCNPLDPEACREGEGCYPGDDRPLCATDASGKQGAAFETCEFINACDPGLLCAGPQAVGACEEGVNGCCTPWCDLEAPDCPEPTMCLQVYPDPLPGLESVGYCGQEPA